VHVVQARTLGLAWLEVSSRILATGVDEVYDDQPTKELALVTLVVEEPDPADDLIASLADPGWLAWMKSNFTEPKDVAELGGARSYARRLRDYDGRDQVQWVIDRLRSEPETRSATITTLQPLSDTSYIPCVSLLDFWRSGGAVELIVYAHSLDFGKKAYGNLVELARLQQEVAAALGLPAGRLVIYAKSAHVYAPELETMRRLAAAP
jgi:thymidylate synthase